MTEIKRWYDKSPKFAEMLHILSNMSDDEINKISKYLYHVVKIIWDHKKADTQEISIGKEKLFGYYQSHKNQRWYDRNPSLRSAVKIMSLLEKEELEEIVEGFLKALKEADIIKIYDDKKRELSENKEI